MASIKLFELSIVSATNFPLSPLPVLSTALWPKKGSSKITPETWSLFVDDTDETMGPPRECPIRKISFRSSFLSIMEISDAQVDLLWFDNCH